MRTCVALLLISACSGKAERAPPDFVGLCGDLWGRPCEPEDLCLPAGTEVYTEAYLQYLSEETGIARTVLDEVSWPGERGSFTQGDAQQAMYFRSDWLVARWWVSLPHAGFYPSVEELVAVYRAANVPAPALHPRLGVHPWEEVAEAIGACEEEWGMTFIDDRDWCGTSLSDSGPPVFTFELEAEGVVSREGSQEVTLHLELPVSGFDLPSCDTTTSTID